MRACKPGASGSPGYCGPTVVLHSSFGTESGVEAEKPHLTLQRRFSRVKHKRMESEGIRCVLGAYCLLGMLKENDVKEEEFSSLAAS